MSYWSDNDATLCRSFASSLGDKGLDSYRHLPEVEIQDFIELSELFVEWFRTGRVGPKTLEDIYALKKERTSHSDPMSTGIGICMMQ
jgi:hypothetical protein